MKKVKISALQRRISFFASIYLDAFLSRHTFQTGINAIRFSHTGIVLALNSKSLNDSCVEQETANPFTHLVFGGFENDIAYKHSTKWPNIFASRHLIYFRKVLFEDYERVTVHLVHLKQRFLLWTFLNDCLSPQYCVDNLQISCWFVIFKPMFTYVS